MLASPLVAGLCFFFICHSSHFFIFFWEKQSKFEQCWAPAAEKWSPALLWLCSCLESDEKFHLLHPILCCISACVSRPRSAGMARTPLITQHMDCVYKAECADRWKQQTWCCWTILRRLAVDPNQLDKGVVGLRVNVLPSFFSSLHSVCCISLTQSICILTRRFHSAFYIKICKRTGRRF